MTKLHKPLRSQSPTLTKIPLTTYPYSLRQSKEAERTLRNSWILVRMIVFINSACANFRKEYSIYFLFKYFSMRSLQWAVGKKATPAFGVRYYNVWTGIRNGKIVYVCPGTANGQRFVWPGRRLTAVAWYQPAAEWIPFAGHAANWYHTRSDTIDCGVHEYYECGHPVRWVVW